MRLVYEESRARWEAITTYVERDLPRAAGLSWDRDAQRWQTQDALKAYKLRAHADAEVLALLDAKAQAAKAEGEAAFSAFREAHAAGVRTAKLAAAQVAEEASAALAASRAVDCDVDIPVAPGRTFLPYQRAGIAYALGRPNVLIGDDMGLGKTAQAIGVINADESLRRILIVCPASLTRNWMREIGFFGSRDLTVGYATTKAVPETDVVIATYDVFSRKAATMDTLRATEWDALILDEAHYLKSESSARTRNILGGKGKKGSSARLPPISARRRIYLTGTPITNRPVEVWPLAHSLAPREFPHFIAFTERYCDGFMGDYGWNCSGSSNLEELQDRLRSTVMVRRLKKDVLRDLPPKRRQVIELPADTDEVRRVIAAEVDAAKRTEAEVARLKAEVKAARASDNPEDYKRAVAALRDGHRVAFTEMSRVRHETAVVKAPMVAEQVREAVEAGGKVIVFAHHKDVVDILRTALADLGVVIVTGDTPVESRQGVVDAFQGDDGIRVFIGNIQAAGVGLTLTASSHVVFAELDWVPGNLSQAEDRAHRLGQRNSVLVQHYVLEESLDARMAASVVSKQAVIDAALDEVEDQDERERRILEAQAEMDAEAEDAPERERRALDVLDAKADRAVAEAERVIAANLARQAERDARRAAVEDGAEPLAPEAVAAVHEALRVLAGMDPDGASEMNGAGFSKFDSDFGHRLAARDALTPGEALRGLGLVRRYRRQLAPALVAAALGESAPVHAPKPDAVSIQAEAIQPKAVASPPKKPWIRCIRTHLGLGAKPVEAAKSVEAVPAAEATPEVVNHPMMDTPASIVPAVEVPEQLSTPALAQAPKRGRGRPPKGEKAMSATERNKLWREAHGMQSIELPAVLASRLRAVRDARGATTAELLAAALEALERQGAAC